MIIDRAHIQTGRKIQIQFLGCGRPVEIKVHGPSDPLDDELKLVRMLSALSLEELSYLKNATAWFNEILDRVKSAKRGVILPVT